MTGGTACKPPNYLVSRHTDMVSRHATKYLTGLPGVAEFNAAYASTLEPPRTRSGVDAL